MTQLICSTIHKSRNSVEGKTGASASLTGFRGVFGSFGAALRAAGFSKNIFSGTSREELLSQLRDLAKELRRIPVVADLNEASKARKCASWPVFKRVFGSFVKARDEAGLPELLAKLRKPR
jgi:hypothetical protein